MRKPPPPTAIPKDAKVRTVESLPPPPPLTAPVDVPDAPPEEADPEDEVIEIVDEEPDGDDFGYQTGAAIGAFEQDGEALDEAPAVPVVRREPVNIPESATPPLPAAGNAHPEYPPEARARGLEGQVILKIVVTEEGDVDRIEVLRGDEPFVAAALSAVRTWRYSPAVLDGNPLPVFTIVRIPFRIRS